MISECAVRRARTFLPKGELKIAQRFSVGTARAKSASPEGTGESPTVLPGALVSRVFSRPFGTEAPGRSKPNLEIERLGYFRATPSGWKSETSGASVKTAAVRLAARCAWLIPALGFCLTAAFAAGSTSTFPTPFNTEDPSHILPKPSGSLAKIKAPPGFKVSL